MKVAVIFLTGAVVVATGSVNDAAYGQAGRQKAVKCQTCHGIDGIAKLPNAPHIAGESKIYLESQLKAFRSGKRVHEIMSVVAKDLTNSDISDLAEWYSSIQISAKLPDLGE